MKFILVTEKNKEKLLKQIIHDKKVKQLRDSDTATAPYNQTILSMVMGQNRSTYYNMQQAMTDRAQIRRNTFRRPTAELERLTQLREEALAELKRFDYWDRIFSGIVTFVCVTAVVLLGWATIFK